MFHRLSRPETFRETPGRRGPDGVWILPVMLAGAALWYGVGVLIAGLVS